MVFVRAELRVIDRTILDNLREDDNVAYVNFDATPKPQIKIRVSGKNRTWALALADDLEPQVERTINKKITPIWFLLIVAAVLITSLIRLKRRLKEGSVP